MANNVKTRAELEAILLTPPWRCHYFQGTLEEYKTQVYETKFTKKANGCWEWNKPLHQFGYGIIVIRKQRYCSHQLAYLLYNGDLNDKHVLHKCDNPKCVNPDHLFLGTQAENIYDCVNKKRQVHIPSPGERNGFSKLTEEDVRDIFYKRNTLKYKLKDIANEYDIVTSCVSGIALGKSWKFLNLKGEKNEN